MSILELESDLSPSVELALIVPVYTHLDYTLKENLFNYQVKYSLYEASPLLSSSHILILDSKGLVTGGRYSYPLRLIDINTLWEKLTDEEKVIFEQVTKKWRKKWASRSPTQSLLKNKIYEPVYRLKDKPITVPWSDFVHELINFRAKKDPRLSLIYRATLLRGFSMPYSPHTLLVTNPATGKSSWYEIAGKRYDKITPNTLVGFAKGADEVHQGVINNQVYPICIEQIESQLLTNFFSFLLSFMENGKATVASGGIEFKVEGTAPIIITANPVGYEVDKTNSFRILIDKLSDNQLALGRRIGLLAFGVDYLQVEKVGGLDEAVWSKYFTYFRAVEERSASTIQEGIFNDDRFLLWLNGAIPNYGINLMQGFSFTDSIVKDFIESHLEQGYRHLRGGALNCAIIDHLNRILEIALAGGEYIDDITAQSILKSANDYLQELVNVNIGSLGNIANLLQKNEAMEKAIFQNCSLNIKEIVVMVRNWKQKQTNIPIRVPLKTMADFQEKRYCDSYEKIMKGLIHDASMHKSVLKNHFGFHIAFENDEPIIVFDDVKRAITVD